MAQRVIDLTSGTAMIVTDLHGDGEVYARYRDRFLALQEQGLADRWILCGDLIHNGGAAADDPSLDLIQDVMRLQQVLGPERVIMLLGNHELAHLYSLPLSRGDVDYTPAFEAALVTAGSAVRCAVLDFIDRLPFYVRTAAGVMIGHCGAAPEAALPTSREQLAELSHEAIVRRVDKLIAARDTDSLMAEYETLFGRDYDSDVARFLGVSSPDDPRYPHLFRTLYWTALNPDYRLLWDAFFTRNERGLTETAYANILSQFLKVWSVGAPASQQVLVTGHIPVTGGHQIVAERQLRLASWAHAQPHDTGQYLLLDCATPVHTPDELVDHLGSILE